MPDLFKTIATATKPIDQTESTKTMEDIKQAIYKLPKKYRQQACTIVKLAFIHNTAVRLSIDNMYKDVKETRK